MQRKTINLSDSVAQKVLLFFDPDTAERKCLHEFAGASLSSESDVLEALVEAGIGAVRERQLEAGYAEWAANWDEEDEAWSKAAAESLARLDDD